MPLVYIEYISRRPGVSTEAFYFATGRGQTGWAGEYAEDVMVLNIGRTFRTGPEPEYMTVWYTPAGEIATGTVDDATGAVTAAWTGPQVAWKMARGTPGAFGGTKINSYGIWLGLCAAFLIGLIDWRRPFTVRSLDVLFLLSFSVSLWFFNRGNIFAAMPFAYPGMVWLAARLFWVGSTDRRPRPVAVWPVRPRRPPAIRRATRACRRRPPCS